MERLIIFAVLLFSFVIHGQTKDTWTTFYNESEELLGYKNSQGEVMIAPRFSPFMTAYRFDDIAAVYEELNGKYDSYYLLKDGTKVGRDSLYVFDNTFDCEQEGLIRFVNRETNLEGMFDAKGNVAIPAIYSALAKSNNGLVLGLKNAKRQYWDEGNHSGCNHYSLVGGETVLLTKENKVLIENFDIGDKSIDLYNYKMSENPEEHKNTIMFQGTDGQYYYFTDLEAVFNDFVHGELLTNPTVDNLLKHSYTSYYSFDYTEQVTNSLVPTAFLESNKKTIEKYLKTIKGAKKEDYYIRSESSAPFSFAEVKELEQYFNNCNEWRMAKYPILVLGIDSASALNKKWRNTNLTFIYLNGQFHLIQVIL
ncbi:hypothetical protein [Myroides odoratimimus]|uniref:hypothetical protein n=1 Tax=Myroides odoratimimus TaxID=76832 RepID=UPI0031014451